MRALFFLSLVLISCALYLANILSNSAGGLMVVLGWGLTACLGVAGVVLMYIHGEN